MKQSQTERNNDIIFNRARHMAYGGRASSYSEYNGGSSLPPWRKKKYIYKYISWWSIVVVPFDAIADMANVAKQRISYNFPYIDTYNKDRLKLRAAGARRIRHGFRMWGWGGGERLWKIAWVFRLSNILIRLIELDHRDNSQVTFCCVLCLSKRSRRIDWVNE